jgi:hypothetical protein
MWELCNVECLVLQDDDNSERRGETRKKWEKKSRQDIDSFESFMISHHTSHANISSFHFLRHLARHSFAHNSHRIVRIWLDDEVPPETIHLLP